MGIAINHTSPPVSVEAALQDCALATARFLAVWYLPVTAPQRAAQTALALAVAGGDLRQVAGAMLAASDTSRGQGVATRQWRAWADRWLALVNRLEGDHAGSA